MEDALLDRRPTELASPLRSYRIRWWLLILASLVAGSQGGIWLLYGVIAEAVEPLYGWDDGTIALLSLWGPVGYLIAAWPTSWLLDACGPRQACVAGATLVFAGSAARAAHFATDSTGSVLAHTGQFLNALAGPVAMSIGPVLSAVWFPASERNAATAIAATANYGGAAVVFWLGSVCVPAGAPADVTRGCLWRLMLGFAVFSGLLLLLGLLTFKARPDSAPSRSATVVREAPLAGIQLLVRSRSFWQLALSYGIGNGVFQGWGSLLGCRRRHGGWHWPRRVRRLCAFEARAAQGPTRRGVCIGGFVLQRLRAGMCTLASARHLGSRHNTAPRCDVHHVDWWLHVYKRGHPSLL
jgi:FLVCR family MFS transporter